jgi:hypothetical protein
MSFLDQSGPVYLLPGCTNKKANNFNPDAQINDNTCVFDSVPIGNEGGLMELDNISINFPENAVNGDPVKIEVAEI